MFSRNSVAIRNYFSFQGFSFVRFARSFLLFTMSNSMKRKAQGRIQSASKLWDEAEAQPTSSKLTEINVITLLAYFREAS